MFIYLHAFLITMSYLRALHQVNTAVCKGLTIIILLPMSSTPYNDLFYDTDYRTTFYLFCCITIYTTWN